jgi:hypothetical protein
VKPSGRETGMDVDVLPVAAANSEVVSEGKLQQGKCPI